MALTPMMQQYLSIKQQYQDALLFFRLGDFYELFFDDAMVASRELEITLTGRDGGAEERIPMCGVPYHAAEGYIKRLIEKGFRVAICEQMEDPALAKGIVKREVIKVITPGTHLDDSEQDPLFLAAWLPHPDPSGSLHALAFACVMTGDIYLDDQLTLSDILEYMNKYRPVELVIPNQLDPKVVDAVVNHLLRQASIAKVEDPFSDESPSGVVRKQFGSDVFAVSGFPEESIAWHACGYLLNYLNKTQKKVLPHLKNPVRLKQSSQLLIDSFTRRNLELFETIRDRKKEGSLFGVLDRAVTAMGSRMIKQWLLNPLNRVYDIQKRLDAIQELMEQFILREDLKRTLRNVYDLERLVAKLSYGTANARDLIALCQTLQQFPLLGDLLAQMKSETFLEIRRHLEGFEDLADRIERAIVPEPPTGLKDGGIIRDGYDEELDRLRLIAREGKHWIAQLERKERDRTNIKSLKIGYNKVFGYYIEVTKSNLALVPDDYERKQTLANAERYVTRELKQREAEILHAEDRLMELEYTLFLQIRDMAAEYMSQLQLAATALANLDALYSLATVAAEHDYVRPIVDQSDVIEIKDGRHPVVEQMLRDSKFVANDTLLNGTDRQIMLITGPNMAGKSTYMRQVALITILAHMGSFVPAKYARIGLVDRVFTRIGAADDLAGGQSTFMVEMVELANILKHATPKSLVILDEIGRGTSTYDGISIAKAVVEFLHGSKTVGAKTLFATHYHELTVLGEELPGVQNFSTQVQDTGDTIVFLRKIVPEPADRSYGIHVAKLAGLPPDVLNRANEILQELESSAVLPAPADSLATVSDAYLETAAAAQPAEVTHAAQLSFFHGLEERVEDRSDLGADRRTDRSSEQEAKVVERLRKLDLIRMTPLEAMNELFALQQQLRKGQKDR
jgi:DNA mismatch repair protein MutS